MNQQTSFLYVEDDPFSREVIGIALQQVMGYEQVWFFEDSADFIERLRALPTIPNVILLDIHIKPIDGFELLNMLKQNGIDSRSHIIAVTASVMNEEVDMLKSSGFDGGIGKPIDPDILPGLIQSIIGGGTVWHITT